MDYGKYVLNDLKLEETIKGMGDRELLEFTVRLSYSNAIRIFNLEGQNKKRLGITGGIGVFIGGIIIGVIEYFRTR